MIRTSRIVLVLKTNLEVRFSFEATNLEIRFSFKETNLEIRFTHFFQLPIFRTLR